MTSMNKPCAFASGRLLAILGGIAAVVILLWAGLAFLLFSEPPDPLPRPLEPMTPRTAAESPARDSAFPPPGGTIYESPEDDQNDQTGGDSPDEEPVVFEEAWQRTINAILTDDAEPSLLSGRLAAALPGMPLDGQLEAAQHMVNLLADEEYVTAETVYFNPSMAEPVRRLVFEDFMNRPNTLKLPLLVRTLRESGHPLRNEAIENLQVYLGRDEGTDWTRWDAAVRETLDRERREEEAMEAERLSS
jgi:hypothetical protein